MTTTPPNPAHFASSIGQGARTLLADDHEAWRVIGAWIATRQRGEAELIRAHALPDAADQVVADARAIITDGGGPMRTGADLDVEVRARHTVDGQKLMDLNIRLKGRVDEGHGGELSTLVSHLSIALLVLEDGVWKIGALLDDASREILANPAFRALIEQQRKSEPETP